MSLDVYLTEFEPTDVYTANITHNLTGMANEAGIYQHLWHPEELGITKAQQLIEPLQQSLILMRRESWRFKKLNAKNGWGTYEDFCKFVMDYLTACTEHPNADVSVHR